MPSNVENILNAILTGDGSGIQKPASRVEELLFEIYEQGGGGGGETVIGGIKLTIDSDYVMTATLVDKDGEEYGTGDNIDLPLETMVVDGEYDSQTQKIKLELKNGNYVEFSVADLVSGLQSELSSSNKLNPAYIAYDASHRAVSDDEKTAWNAKQNAITDLETIRSGAAKGATAVQPATMTEALAAKQNSLDSAQLAAVNSGIDSTKVAQIETNKANILSVKQKVGVNLLNTNEFSGGTSDTGIDFTTENGIISAKGTKMVADSYRNIPRDDFKASSQYYVVATTTGSPRISLRVFGYKNGNYTQLIDTSGTAIFNTGDYESFLTRVVVGGSINDTVNASISAMIISKEDYEAGLTAFQPYGASNYELTRLEAEDRAALAEEIDAGAKNLLSLPMPISSWAYDSSVFTISESNGEVTVSKTASSDIKAIEINLTTPIKTNTYLILSGCPSGGGANSYQLDVWDNGTFLASDEGSGSVPIKFSTNTQKLRIRFATGAFSNIKFKPMLATKAEFDVSQEYVPYRPDYVTLSKQSTYTTSTTNTSISNLLYNAAKAVGFSDPAADTKSFFASIFTETINECLFLYGVYKHGVLGYAVSTANKGITLNAINNLGTVSWTGGTAPYHVQVRFF